jgi:hypothetical protein
LLAIGHVTNVILEATFAVLACLPEIVAGQICLRKVTSSL